MIVDQLLLHFLGHSGQGEVGALEFSFESGQSGGNLLFHLLVLSFSQAGVERVALQRAAASHAGRDDVLTL